MSSRGAAGACTALLLVQPLVDASSARAEVHAEPAQMYRTPPAAKPEVSPVPVAVGARVERNGRDAKLTFDLSSRVDVRSFVLENPDRLVVESSQVNFQIDPSVGRPKPDASSLVKAFRFGTYAEGKSRIVIDLAAPARVQRVAVEPIADQDASRLVIEFARCDRTSFHQAAIQPSPADPQTPPDAGVLPSSTAKPVVVIDPGHGGIDPGAIGIGGVLEKQLTYVFGSVLAAKLNGTGRYTVVMTRDGDEFVSLRDRVKKARDTKAALFVSIHADTVTEGEHVAGATIYTAADRASDAESARVAEKENKADEAAGADSAPEASEVSDILFDLTRRETRTFSHSFQRTLTGYWQKIAHLNKNPERSAGFWVLKAPDVPSVLLELGYLSSQSDVSALTSPQWRDQASTAVAASIDSFFDARGRDRLASGRTVASRAADLDSPVIVALRPHL